MTSQKRDLITSTIAAIVLSVFTTGAFVFQYSKGVPANWQRVLAIISVASYGGIVPGAILGGILQGSPHGPVSDGPMIAIAIPINAVIYLVGLLGTMKLVRVLGRPSSKL